MSESMVERVARAIYEAELKIEKRPDCPEWSAVHERVKGFFMDEARAAIAATFEHIDGIKPNWNGDSEDYWQALWPQVKREALK